MAKQVSQVKQNGFRLEPITTVMQPIPCFIAFDTETNGNVATKKWDGYDEDSNTYPGEMKCCCIYGEYKSKDGNRVTTVDETFTDRAALAHFFRDIFRQGRVVTKIVAYNLPYDMWYIFDDINVDKILPVGTRIISAQLKNFDYPNDPDKKGIEMFDLWNHTGGTTLEKWFDILKLSEKGLFKTEHPELMKMPELIEHCRMDARATWEVAEYFKKIYGDIGVQFKLTTSSVAMNLYQRQFMGKGWFRTDERCVNGMTLNEMERKAYYGGRCETLTRGIHNVQSYDLNSTYVSVMRDELMPMPNDNYSKYYPKNRVKEFWYFLDGKHVKPVLLIAHVRVKAPKSRVMVLPWRNPKDGKLLFPWGEFSGWWTSPELKAALSYGYEILEVKEYIVYTMPVKLFSNYAEFCYGNRITAQQNDGKGSAFDLIWKLMGNGLYGKFAQQNNVVSGYSSGTPIGMEGLWMNRVEAYGNEFYITGVDRKEEALNAFPCLSAFIASYARLKLLEKMKEHEDTVMYVDTDSVKYPDHTMPETVQPYKAHLTTNELGGWKYEPENSGMMLILRSKLYGHIEEMDVPEEYDFLRPLDKILAISGHNWKIKGLGSKCENLILDLTKRSRSNPNGMSITGTARRPVKMREAFRRDLLPNVWRDIDKRMDIIDDKRVWIGQDSEPLYIRE